MTIKLEVGNKVLKSVPKNQYVVEVNFEHGDADNTTIEEMVFDTKNTFRMSILNAYLGLFLFLKQNREKGTEQFELAMEYAKDITVDRRGENINFADILNGGFWSHDVYNERHRATLERWSITYFNEDGIEFDVKVSDV